MARAVQRCAAGKAKTVLDTCGVWRLRIHATGWLPTLAEHLLHPLSASCSCQLLGKRWAWRRPAQSCCRCTCSCSGETGTKASAAAVPVLSFLHEMRPAVHAAICFCQCQQLAASFAGIMSQRFALRPPASFQLLLGSSLLATSPLRCALWMNLSVA